MTLDTAFCIDCHVHVFDPVRFPYAPDTAYRPQGAEIATAAQLGRVLDAHGVRHAVIVGPNSGYGFDNRCLLDALATGQGRYRGVAVVPNGTGRDELQALQAAGVIGIAFNPSLLGVDFYRDAGPLFERLRDLGMWAQVQVTGEQLVDLAPMLEASGAKLLFDHGGRPEPRAGLAQPGFVKLLELGRTGRAVVKLSGLAKWSHLPHPYEDTWPFVQALVDAFTPDGLVWASDWPFLRAPDRIDYGPLQALAAQLLPDPQVRHAVMWENPRRLFGF